MSYGTGTATDYADLLDQLDTFLTSQGMTLSPSFSGAGNGTIGDLIGGAASVAETITVTFTSATAFDVAGSISGAIGSGTVGVAFVSSKINFTITAGGTPFAALDVFTVATTPPWTSERRVAGTEMIWKGPGNGGLDAIYVGAKIFSNLGADYYNWRLGGFTAFNSGLAFESQAGYLGGVGQAVPSPVLNLWNHSIPYWFVANGRRVIVIAKVSTVYVMAYLGFMSTYPSPGAFPYPLVVGGSMAWQAEPAANSVNWRWSYTGNEIDNFPFGYGSTMSQDYQSPLRLRVPSGTWRGFDRSSGEATFGQIWPYANSMTDWRTNLDGNYTLLPVVLHDAVPNIYGEFDGVLAITGFSNAAENTITIGSSIYLIVQNVSKTTKIDYCAIKLI
jgi:hypothetical protein